MIRAPGAPKRVVVTGAGGFLGSHLCQHFLSEGFQTWACGRLLSATVSQDLWFPEPELLEIDLPSPRFARQIAAIQPDLVVHCASSASVPQSMKDPLSDLRQSVLIYGEILEAVRTESPGATVAFLSSAAVYGQPKNLPTSEEEPAKPISPYGFHKWMCELLSTEYGELYGLKTLNLRIFSAYGERLYKQVVFDILTKLHSTSLDVVELHGTGNETRDFLHAHDIARSVLALYHAGSEGTFNLASGEATDIRTLAGLLAERSPGSKEIRFRGEARPGDPDRWCANVSKLQSIGFRPAISLAEGLDRTTRWFEARRSSRP